VLLEAWANGKPNVAYRAGGIAGVIRGGEDGLLVPCGDVAALAEALTRLVHNGELREQLGSAGKARTLREFRWEDKLATVREMYADLVERKHPSPAPWGPGLGNPFTSAARPST
jgi:glycosyltransferase involved in cell wall biosynthesis